MVSLNTTATSAPVYATACAGYYHAGWTCIIPVPPVEKHPPPGGYTGAGGRDTSPEDIARLATAHADWSVALRMPDGVIGIDIDQYAKHGTQKKGAETIARLEAELGPLPPTYTSTARGPGQPSRIRFYRVPPGRYAGVAGADVEIIQRHHRYAVVAPSAHETGGTYAWYAPDGSPLEGRVPGPGNFPELPESWVRYLAAGAAAAGPAAAGREAGGELLANLSVSGYQPACVAMAATRHAAVQACQSAEAGSRHDTALGHVYELVMLGTEGHPGALAVLEELRELWDQLTAGEDRDAEFTEMITTAARKAVTKNGGPDPQPFDGCLMQGALSYQAPVPGAADGQPPGEPAAAPQAWSPFMAIGAEPFDPQAELDTPLADAVLHRTWPVLRYAPDAGSWLVRGPERWDVRKADLARWAVDLVSRLMPRGDPGAPDGSDGKRRAQRRARFATNAASAGIAGKMNAQVTAGHHPSTTDLAGLDAEQEILWAGGWPYDLRQCASGPAVAAGTDPGMPHLHSAGVIPDLRPTPLWDAYTAAVWPDEDLRAWALRVLAVAFTGYSDKALPILLGETDTGKTEVIKLLMSVLGSYAHVADARLLSPADRSHASIVYALKGRRLSFIDEAPRAGALAQERLKQITGGAELTGNRMGENPVTFVPTHTLILTANPQHEPVLTDAAVRRRVRLIPCGGDPARVRAARAAIGLTGGPAWRAEAPGVLAAMMTEAARWLADPDSAGNSAAPEAGLAAAEEIAASQDPVLAWLTEECEPWGAGTRSRDLYAAFTESCRRINVPGWAMPTETAWGRRLNDLGYPVVRHRDANYRRLRIRPPQTFTPTLAEFTGHSGGAAQAEPVNGTPERGGSTLHGGGSEVSENETLHNGNGAGQTIHIPSTVEGVDSHSDYLYTHTRTHTRAQGGRHQPPTLHATLRPSTDPAAGPLPEPAPGPVSPLEPESPRVTTVAPGQPLGFDLETAGADDLFRYEKGRFVRLAGITGPGGEREVVSVPSLIAATGEAGIVYGHNILGFDGLALAFHHGLDWHAFAAKARDTELIARQVNPPRSRESGTSADRYGLDAVAGELGLPGKTGHLPRLARKHGGYDKIPPDDPEYREYLLGDLAATRAVADALMPYYDADPYLPREHKLAAIAGQMSLNGFAVDHGLLEQRVAETEGRKRQALELLHKGWGLPLGRTVMRGRGKARHEVTEMRDSPLSTKEGKAWLEDVFARHGITDPPRTGGKKDVATGAEDLKTVTARPDCPPGLKTMIALIGVAVGARTVYQTATDWTCPDGRVHPKISFRQASGRWSFLDPGLTVYGKHGGRHVERMVFTADPGEVLVSLDLAQIDMRVIAGHCQDPEYMKLFAPGRDAHAEIAVRVFGTAKRRQDAKARGHGWNYGMGPKRMIKDGIDPAMAYGFDNGMQNSFPVLCSWRDQVRAIGEAGQLLDNGFGRRMRCDPQWAFTVAPALMGQGGARDALGECLLQMPSWTYPMMRAMVHDEIIFSVHPDVLRDLVRAASQAMTWTWRGVPILCDLNGPGLSWGDISGKCPDGTCSGAHGPGFCELHAELKGLMAKHETAG